MPHCQHYLALLYTNWYAGQTDKSTVSEVTISGSVDERFTTGQVCMMCMWPTAPHSHAAHYSGFFCWGGGGGGGGETYVCNRKLT